MNGRGMARSYEAGRRHIRELNRRPPTERQLAFWAPKRQFRPILVDTRIAMSELGFSHWTIQQMREAGELRWVWDVSVKANQIESVRFWLGELMRLKTGDLGARNMGQDDVIQAVVGHETQTHLRSQTVCDMLLITHPTLMALHGAEELAGEVVLGVRQTTRESLVGFLGRRLLS